MRNKLVFGDGKTNNVSKITTGGARADLFLYKTGSILRFDITKRCAISGFLETISQNISLWSPQMLLERK